MPDDHARRRTLTRKGGALARSFYHSALGGAAARSCDHPIDARTPPPP